MIGLLLAIPVLIGGFLVMGALVLLWRSFCEFYVAIFRISEDLAVLRDSVDAERKRDRRGPAAPARPTLRALARRAHADFVEFGVLAAVGFLGLGGAGALGHLLVLLLLFEGLGQRVAGAAFLGLDGVDLGLDGGLADLQARRNSPPGTSRPRRSGRRAWSPPRPRPPAPPAGSRRRRGA